MTRRLVALACALATLSVPSAVSAADRPVPPSNTVTGVYRLSCSNGTCVVDVEGSAADIAEAARPMIVEMVAALPESVVVQGKVIRRPDVETVVAQYRDYAAAQIRSADPSASDAEAGAGITCTAGANIAYTKNQVDLFFYTQSYYVDLNNIDAISCVPSGTSIYAVVWCASFGLVAGYPMSMLGSGPAFHIDGTFTDYCAYAMTPSAVGPLPNSLYIVRMVLGVNAWSVIGPDRVTLPD